MTSMDGEALGRAIVDGGRVRVVGEFDMSNSAEFRAALQEAARCGDERLVIDLTDVAYLDSSALAVLWQYADHRPRLVARSGSVVERVLALTGFTDLQLVDLES